jgi:hypothetical protein
MLKRKLLLRGMRRRRQRSILPPSKQNSSVCRLEGFSTHAAPAIYQPPPQSGAVHRVVIRRRKQRVTANSRFLRAEAPSALALHSCWGSTTFRSSRQRCRSGETIQRALTEQADQRLISCRGGSIPPSRRAPDFLPSRLLRFSRIQAFEKSLLWHSNPGRPR